MGYLLLVEANPGMRNWCRMHLSTAGHAVSAADDARQALRVARTRPPDLVLIATDLEGTTAYALAATLRAETRTADTPILLLAPAEDAQAIAQASAIVPGDVLTKPLTRDKLLSAVAQRLEARAPGSVSSPPADVPKAAPAAVRAPPPAILSMESKTVSLLSVTLRNLVSLARLLRGKSLDALIQRFLAQAREAVVAQGGWVVRIDATGLLAVFETSPNDRRNHASLAIEAALYVVLAARRAKRWAEATLFEPSLPTLSIGCGVHSGEVIVARLPLDGHITPSLVGVTVDIASRLNGRAKGLGWSVAVSEASALLSGSRFEFWRRASLADTDHGLTLSILECGGFNPGGVMPQDLPVTGEVREAVEANTVIAGLAGDIDPSVADRTILVRDARPVEAFPDLPDRRIGRRLGHGSHVTTYAAVYQPTGRQEAVKTVALNQVSPKFVDHYLDTYRHIKDQQRREVVAVHEIGRTKDTVYVATELLPGPALSDVIRRRVAVGDALNLVAQMCRSLDVVHGFGMFHGALRADHFLFRDERSLVLTDFNASGRAMTLLDTALMGADGPQVRESSRIPELDHFSGMRADLRAAGLILLAMSSADASVIEAALADNVANLARVSRLSTQLSSLQPLLDGLVGVDGRRAFESAAEALAALAAVEGLWSRPVFPQE